MRGRLGVAASFLLLALSSDICTAQVSVTLIDSTSGSYLKQAGQTNAIVDGNWLSAIVAALLNVQPPAGVSAVSSQEISSIVRGSPFEKPDALVSLTIAGAKSGNLANDLPNAKTFPGQTDSILQSLSTLQFTGGVEYNGLDVSSLPGCGEACLEQLLQNAIQSLGLTTSYKSSGAVLRSELSIQVGSETATFDLETVSDRLFAMELASLWATVQDAASEKQRRVLQDAAGYRQPQLLQRALISPQAVKEAHGEASTQYRVAAQVMQQVATSSIKTLQTAYDGRLVALVSSIEEVSQQQQTTLMSMLTSSSLENARKTARSLLADSGDSAYLEQFIAWIAMWGTFFLLLFFALTGCHCLKTMKFKQDSLLYGKNKTA